MATPPKVRQARIGKIVERPLEDPYTVERLKGEGFDLTGPITWEDDAAGIRTFRQDEAPTPADRMKKAVTG